MKLTLLFALITSLAFSDQPFDLINGTPVEPGTFKEVVRIQTGNSGCTATVIGPRVIVTAAHCGGTGQTAVFTIDGKRYGAKLQRHSLYPSIDVDVSLGISPVDIEVTPASVAEERVVKGDVITLMGYGCVRPGGGGGNDGILRYGDTVVTRASSATNSNATVYTTARRQRGRFFQWLFGKKNTPPSPQPPPSTGSYDIVSYAPNGAALCFGDSGGPAFLGGKQVSVNSKGNIKDTNYTLDLTNPPVRSWMKGIAERNAVDICGLTVECAGE